jgi:putative iron-regulated protein
VLAVLKGLTSCQPIHVDPPSEPVSAPSPVAPTSVVSHYADLAHVVYLDALFTAQRLQQVIDVLIAAPTESNLSIVRDAWKFAREPYQQSEVLRFGNRGNHEQPADNG